MSVDRRELLAALAPGALLWLWTLAGAGLVHASLSPEEWASFQALLADRAALIVVVWLGVSAAVGAWARRAWQHWVEATGRVAEQAQVLARSGVQRELSVPGASPVQAVQSVINELVRQRTALQADIDTRVRAASRDIDVERSRLAALMAELAQSVVVCNLDGRILLYNSRARLQFRALSDAVAAGTELVGIGRSIYAVFDRQLVAHALESVHQRLQRGAANPSAQFVTGTRGGQLLRVQVAPVRAMADDGAAVDSLAGFVLMLDNITRDYADESARDRLLHQLTETSRASLGQLRAAVSKLDDPALDPASRERHLGVVRSELDTMSGRVDELALHTNQRMRTRWPLEEMLGADLVATAARRIESLHGCRAAVDAVDHYSLVQALVSLAGRLVEAYGIRFVQLRLRRSAAAVDGPPGTPTHRAELDLVWIGQAMSTETVMSWETDPLQMGGEVTGLTVRDVVQRHGGAFGFQRERVRQEAFFRFELPLAAEGAALEARAVLHSDSRPEYYDFDLFAVRDGDAALADRPLNELAFTVFDTETTGLNPSQGDEIIQIGATRIMAGKLRRQECFEQLVDPKRPIPAAGIAIHGITADRVAGQPDLATVLPGFHAFALDTVLVAHNAAFDMRFLQLKEASTGLRFDQPVLDTLLLSAVIHPQQESHRLEAIAERLGVTVLGRHTALGDAMVTAEVFIKMLPLLSAIGIHTLGQARDAAQKTYLARVNY
jgi:DNA polymerase III subunit epsilon